MKKSLVKALVLTGLTLLVSSSAIAAECSGSWRVMPNYNPGSGGVCAALGLNTHQAVCQPGQRFATYCDDASGGRYRTCQSSIPCSRAPQRNYGSGGDRDDYNHSRYYGWDDQDGRRNDSYYGGTYRRDDYYGPHEERWDDRNDHRNRYQNTSRDCTNWDNNLNRPCAPGTINRDCRNGCDGSR